MDVVPNEVTACGGGRKPQRDLVGAASSKVAEGRILGQLRQRRCLVGWSGQREGQLIGGAKRQSGQADITGVGRGE